MTVIYVDFSAITTPEFSKTPPDHCSEVDLQLTGSVSDHLVKLVQIANNFWEQYTQELEEDLLTQAGYVSHILTLYDNFMNYE